MRSMPPPLPAGPARPTKPPGLPPGKGLTASPPAETMVSQQPVQPVRQSVPPTASKVEVQKAPAHSAAPRPAAPTGKPTVKMEAVRTTARYSEAPKEEPSRPDAAKAAVPKASPSAPATTATALPAAASSEGAAGAASVTSITAAPAIPPAAISPDVARAQRLAQMARASSDDTGATWTGAEDRPSEPETPQSKRGANGNADRMSSDPKTPPAALVEERGSRGKYGPPTTRFTSSSSVAEIDAWPTAALTGEVPADFHDENKTRIDAPAYKDSDDLYDGSAIVPPKTGDVRPTQAVRVVVWRAADGVHVAPHGTTVSAISVDAMLVALDPTADLFAWLKGK